MLNDELNALRGAWERCKFLPILFVGQREQQLDLFGFIGRVAEEDFDGLADFFAPRIAAGEARGAVDAVQARRPIRSTATERLKIPDRKLWGP